MRRLILISVVLLAGCSWFRSPPETGITTGATVIYNGGPGGELFSLCDRGNLVYLTKSQPAVAIVKDGCNPQIQDATLAQALAVKALADRPVERPIPLPSPLPVMLVANPAEPREPREVRVESREPIIVHVEPPAVTVPACPVCPVAPPVFTPQASQLPAPPPQPQAKQMPAPAPKAAPKMVVVQADPNSASTEDLERLPGVTNKMALAIVRGRPYRSLQELASKKALTEAELQALAPYLALR